jgi:hypothetical protein
MQRPLRIAALMTLLTLAVLGSQPQASGAPPTMAPTPYLADASDPAVTTLAKDRNISIQEAQRRIGWQQPALELGEELRRALGDRFGGLWIDPADGGRVKVGIRGSATADARTLIARRQLSAVTDLVPVRHSYADLEAANKRLGKAAATANRGTSQGIQTGLRISRNAIHLHLQLPRGHRLTAAQQAVVDTAKQRYGTSLVVDYTDQATRPYTCAWVDLTDINPPARRFTCDAPLRAGVFTSHPLPGPDVGCTTGFYAQSKVDTEKYIMTAGHCLDESGQGGTWYAYQPQPACATWLGRNTETCTTAPGISASSTSTTLPAGTPSTGCTSTPRPTPPWTLTTTSSTTPAARSACGCASPAPGPAPTAATSRTWAYGTRTSPTPTSWARWTSAPALATAAAPSTPTTQLVEFSTAAPRRGPPATTSSTRGSQKPSAA